MVFYRHRRRIDYSIRSPAIRIENYPYKHTHIWRARIHSLGIHSVIVLRCEEKTTLLLEDNGSSPGIRDSRVFTTLESCTVRSLHPNATFHSNDIVYYMYACVLLLLLLGARC